ncbi:DUF6702 family protein [Draconibacterium halophilum]|uniref:Uncharacterized protein n=1 Tax=Draconibacterium halophilum TaxID=2706887 RepID=A0A6C0RE67_9BACT|nr:DUF6702 family protein [Draconibacterium halophilum]QIA08409.1 hypothetical protein G0Q07_12105 [Draconibacterium halophilum]
MKISKKLILPVLFLFLGVFFSQAHPFYVSICQLNYNEQNQSLEISVKIFADDLLAGLSEEGHTKLYLGESRESEHADEYIYTYLKQNIRFKVNEKAVEPKFVGKEMEKDVVWTYLEIDDIVELNNIEVSCYLLTDVFSDQSNIIQVTKNGKMKNLLLSKRETRGRLNFD